MEPSAVMASPEGVGGAPGGRCDERHVWRGTRAPDRRDGEEAYACQATQLPYATTSLAWWDVRQYVEDYTSGNVGVWQLIKGLVFSSYYHLGMAGIGFGRISRWLYDRCVPLWGGTLFPWHTGGIPEGEPTPAEELGVQPGEWVRIKTHREILKTVTTGRRNRGLYFDAEMVPYCGSSYRVLTRVSRIIDERTGKLIELKTQPLILEGVFCKSRYSYCRMFCPRSIYAYWRETWVERVAEKVENGKSRGRG